MTEATVTTPQSTGTSTDATPIVVQPLPKTGMKGGPGSADDLLNAYDEEISAETTQGEEAADKQVKIQETAAKKQAAKEVVKTLEQEPEAVEGEEPTQEGEEQAEEAAEEALEALLNGEVVKVPEKAEIQLEVDGKPVKFTVAEAVEAKLGQEKFNRNIEQRLSYAAQREKRADAKIDGILAKAQQAIEAAKTGEPLPAIKALARLAAGNEVDAVEVERQFLENLQKVDQIYNRMTPEQRAQYFAEQRAKAAEERAKKLESEVGFSEQIKQTHAEIDTICQQVGLSRDAFTALYNDFIIPHLVGPDKPFKTIEEIGPREVANVHIEFSTRDKVQTALTEVDPELAKDAALAEELYRQAIQNLSWQKEDLKYIINQIVRTPSKSVQNLNRKVERAKTQRLNSTLKQGSATKKGEEIDEQLYNDFFRKAEKEGWAGRLK